jgi:hypothetical protein
MKAELANPKRFRTRNKPHYRLAHWPIWIAVFFLAPGPWVFDLFERGIDYRLLLWLAVVILATGWAGWLGRLPGVEPAPYIIRFTEDKPNPLYRRVCYTFAWNAALNYGILNLAGLLAAAVTGHWRLKQIYQSAYFPLLAVIGILGILGRLPRVKSSTRGEGKERRYFYATIWAVLIAQPVLGLLWKVLPHTRAADWWKLGIFAGLFTLVGLCSKAGLLPRTRAVIPGELAVSD